MALENGANFRKGSFHQKFDGIHAAPYNWQLRPAINARFEIGFSRCNCAHFLDSGSCSGRCPETARMGSALLTRLPLRPARH
jgi:hypothetical protein